MRSIRYQEIADDLRARLAAGEFPAGRTLPSEKALGEHYRASRVTIRRSLEVLRDEGLVASRQGFGWVAAAEPVPQVLDTLATIEAQLDDAGRTAEREILDFAFEAPPRWVREHLGDRALGVRRRHRADGEPFARVSVWCRDDVGAEVSRADVEKASFLELLPVDWGRAHQTIGAALAEADDGDLLGVPVGSAVLVVRRITTDTAGGVVLVSEHVFPAHLTEFEIDLALRSELRLRGV